MASGSNFLSLPRDLRQLLALLALLLGLGEFADAFFISFWEGAAVFSVLFLAATLWSRRGGIGGPILVGALCLFELQSFPTWHRHGAGDWISQIAFVVVAAAGLLVTLVVLKQSFSIRRAKARAARIATLLGVLGLVSAGAALADAGGQGTVTITQHANNVVLFSTPVTNPCNGETGTLTAVAANEVFHVTFFTAPGADEFWMTGTDEGTATITPDTPGGGSASGHFVSWFGESSNNHNDVKHSTNTFNLTGSDGTHVVMHETFHLSTSATGVTVGFDKSTMTLSCG